MRQHPVSRKAAQPGFCPICAFNPIDTYQWCRPCIARAARGLAREEVRTNKRFAHFSGDDLTLMLRRQQSRFQHQLKRRLRRRT